MAGRGNAEAVVAAAWLHDIGYAQLAADSGFHSLDGARHLRREGWPDLVVNLVAHHSCARFEAEERGLSGELDTFPRESELLEDALTYADMTVGPTGERMSPEDRVAEILDRYPPESPVHRAISRARPELLAACARTADRLRRAGIVDEELDALPPSYTAGPSQPM